MNKKKLMLLMALLGIVLLAFAFFKSLPDDKVVVGKAEPTIQKTAVIMPNITHQKHSKADIMVDHQILAKKPLPSPQDTQSEQQRQKKPTPILNLQVKGVFLAQNKGSGYALIAYNGIPPQVYSVGARLAEGVVVKKLSTGEVTIDNNGQLEKYQVIEVKAVKAIGATSVKLAKPVAEQPPKIIKVTPPMDDFNPPLPYEAPLKSHLTPAQSLEYEFTPPPPDDGMRPE